MNSPWKPRLEALEVRDTPAVLHLLVPSLQVVYPPADPTDPVSTAPPSPDPAPAPTPIIVITPPPAPWIPGW